MSIRYTYYKINEDGSKTLLDLPQRFALLQTWLNDQGSEVKAAYNTAHARNLAQLAGQEISPAIHPPVDPEWKAFWDRFLVEANLEQVLSDE
jgi:hypothetical protein